MDQGNIGDEALSRPGPFYDHHNHHAQFHHLHHPHSHYHDDDTDNHYAVAPPSAFDAHSRPSQIPIASYATANLQAFAANSLSPLPDDDALADSLDPDDFYRSYRGVQSANASPPLKDLMAPGPATVRKPPSLRSNGNGTTPKHPPVPSATRIGIRPGFRSASNPVDDRPASTTPRPSPAPANGYGPAPGVIPPSVKDLKKKFDLPASQSTSLGRKAVPRTSSRDATPAAANARSSVPGSATSPTSYASLRSNTTQSAGNDTARGSGSRGTQRSRFTAEDQLSANTQSFASRITKPRTANPTDAQPLKSTSQVPQGMYSEMLTSSLAQSRSNGLLFGEILPDESDSVTAGFGIDVVRPRRTSESSLHTSARPHQRSFSDPDVEPPSPTDWYRSAASGQQDSGQQESRTTVKNHSRARSDLVGSSKPDLGRSERGTTRHIINILPLSPNSPKSPASLTSPTSPISPSSRLPILVKKLSDPSGRGSPGSTRSNSPATLRYTGASGRTSRQRGTTTARAKTPTNRSHTPTSQAKTLSQAPGSSRKPPPSNISTPSSSRLNAFVSIPVPKLSPTLRSSRPRQSVATATTTASRMKTVEGAPSSNKAAHRGAPSRPDDAAPRRRKVSVGPIDFAQRRETIKLAYSKSVKENQAKEARRTAAEKRKKELEAVARAKVEAEAAALAATEAAAATTPTLSPAVDSDRLSQTLAQKERERASVEVPLKIMTDLSQLQHAAKETGRHFESLELGMPGSFPTTGPPQVEDEEGVPQSAISNATATTEFDIDEQAESPTEPNTAAIDRDLGGLIIGHMQGRTDVEPLPLRRPRPPVPHKKASYHYPFADEDAEDQIIDEEIVDGEDIDDGNVSIKISLDTSSVKPSPQQSPQLTPTRSDFDPEPAPPNLSQDEYEPQPYSFSSPNYETMVTILGPGIDFTPSYRNGSRSTMSAADLHQANKSLAAETMEIVASGDAPVGKAQSDEPRAEVEGLDRLEDFYIPVRLHENIASLRDRDRDSTFTSSDPDVSYDAQPSSADYQKTLDTSHSLTVPGLLSHGNRLSQQSAWTDFSFGSDDPDLGAASSGNLAHDPTPQREARNSTKLSASPVNLSAHDLRLDLGGLSQSPELSPLDNPSVPSPPMLAGEPAAQIHLPELDTGDGFSVPYSPLSKRIPALPDHAPPRPPGDEYQLDGSAYVVGTRPNSYLHSHDEREDLTQPIPTPRSIGQLSIESPDSSSAVQSDSKTPPAEAQGPWAEEQKRLRQRLLVIRELIDTEDLFVRDMSVVEELYKGTAEACPKLDSKAIKLIFRNTDEVIGFHGTFLAQLKEGASSVYTPKGRRSPLFSQDSSKDSDSVTLVSTNSGGTSNKPELDNEKDRLTSIGPLFLKNIDQLKVVHEVYLRSSDASTKRLIQIQDDSTVMIWLNECNEMAKELTSAWNLDSLLIKPMQRITKYPDIIAHLLKYTPEDHPDREALASAKTAVINAIDEINKTKKNFELVGQIVGNRKRKESDVRAGLARAFGKRVDKLQASNSNNRPPEDEEYLKLHEKFGDDYLRLQVVLRDVEFYTRNVATYVQDFLKYLSSMELVMRLQPSREHAHIESKWVQFNVSMRDIEKIALEKHLSDVRKHVIEPFEQVIKCYGNPTLAMKKRAKRRLDYEKSVQLKANGKKVDKQLGELVEQYEALNVTLKKELPKLSELTAKIGNICLGKFVSIQATWFSIWKEKVKTPLQDVAHVPELPEIVSSFQREFGLQEERAKAIGILNPALKGRSSQSTTDDSSSIISRTKSRPSDLVPPRGRGMSVNSDYVPSLPTPDFAKRNSGQFNLSPTSSTIPSPGLYYRDYYAGINGGQTQKASGSPVAPDPSSTARASTSTIARPSTGRSFESANMPRQSTESATQALGSFINRRDSNSTYNSNYLSTEPRRLSGLFHSALPLPDGPDESRRSSRASSRERGPANHGYRVMWLAASLFEFNIETTKHEAGYPYLTYQAGEIFDVIAEKGELWLAKNQDDPRDLVGWIWSKHFAKLADS
ncbi:hypothetical protein B0T26DRAFT_670574 [Lasiosphaeria miniovina]|uniref:DH domain-containing protein n=1 Tax=Lasiosphaeria miniovina TaxID=1954250 RepID=A0AA40BHC0_9PEZI|nr:uncharacterized protein B0T26DRAFT_670574 [Lasiosphaeria miniovina]KAK0734252.1 hypothetical protein B0T26DRAFT_670574 [Lasiosphaeria miniovina]